MKISHMNGNVSLAFLSVVSNVFMFILFQFGFVSIPAAHIYVCNNTIQDTLLYVLTGVMILYGITSLIFLVGIFLVSSLQFI